MGLSVPQGPTETRSESLPWRFQAQAMAASGANGRRQQFLLPWGHHWPSTVGLDPCSL